MGLVVGVGARVGVEVAVAGSGGGRVAMAVMVVGARFVPSASWWRCPYHRITLLAQHSKVMFSTFSAFITRLTLV